MEISAAILADYASVREGLLFVTGGGISRLWRVEVPSPLNCFLALIIEIHETETDRPHEIQVIVQGPDGVRLAELRGAFVTGRPADLSLAEGILTPLALDLRSAAIQQLGDHSIEVAIDGQAMKTVTFVAARPPQASADV